MKYVIAAMIAVLITAMGFAISSAIVKNVNNNNYLRENYEKTEYVVIGNKGVITPVYKITEVKDEN